MEIIQEFLFLIIGFSCRLTGSQVTSFNCSDNTYAYIRPDNSQKSWNRAQTVCRHYKATLPIVDNPQRQSCFAAALSYFQMNSNRGGSLEDVWLGANSSGGDPKIWKWLDGSLYNGTVEESHRQRSYVFVTIGKDSKSATIKASEAKTRYYYICLYSTTDNIVCQNRSKQTAYIRDGRCFVKYNEALSWFNARNQCLSNNGDLASFSDISLLKGLYDSTWYGSYWKDSSPTSDPFWIGLRSIWWNWSDAVTGQSADVTFTLWYDYQPYEGYYPQCITAASTDYSRWQDTGCNSIQPFICQVKLSTSTSSSTETPVRRDSTSMSFMSIPKSTSQTETPESASDNDNKGINLSTSSPVSTKITSRRDSTSMPLTSIISSKPRKQTSEAANDNNDKGNSNAMLLAVGLGVGIGVSLILALTVVTALFCRRRRKMREVKQHKSTTSKSEGISGKNSEQNSVPLVETTSPECTYAIVKPMDKSEEKAFETSYTPIEYAKLDFNKDDTYQNIN